MRRHLPEDLAAGRDFHNPKFGVAVQEEEGI